MYSLKYILRSILCIIHRVSPNSTSSPACLNKETSINQPTKPKSKYFAREPIKPEELMAESC
jgi:hypothetical protein